MGSMNVKRTKIVCTIGPASDSVEKIISMVQNGMDIARVSFSHGTHEEKARGIRNIKIAEQKLNKRIPILQDLSGPKIRIGEFGDEVVYLEEGKTFRLTTKNITGNEQEVSFNTPEILSVISVGQTVFLADGEIQLQVESVEEDVVSCQVT